MQDLGDCDFDGVPSPLLSLDTNGTAKTEPDETGSDLVTLDDAPLSYNLFLGGIVEGAREDMVKFWTLLVTRLLDVVVAVFSGDIVVTVIGDMICGSDPSRDGNTSGSMAICDCESSLIPSTDEIWPSILDEAAGGVEEI